jgi:hypothetical protein
VPRSNEVVVFKDFFTVGLQRAASPGAGGHFVEVPCATAPIDVKCDRANWQIHLGG